MSKTITLRQSGSDGADIFTFPLKDWRTATKALIARNPQYNLSHMDLDSSHWAQLLFWRMGFKQQMRTTGKVEIPEGARKEAELLYLHNIITIVKKYKIPHSLNKELGKPKQATLVIMDVLRGQITDDVIFLLRDNNIHYVLVPNSMTKLFQPLDLAVNKHCKSYLKQLFSEWYAQ